MTTTSTIKPASGQKTKTTRTITEEVEMIQLTLTPDEAVRLRDFIGSFSTDDMHAHANRKHGDHKLLSHKVGRRDGWWNEDDCLRMMVSRVFNAIDDALEGRK